MKSLRLIPLLFLAGLHFALAVETAPQDAPASQAEPVQNPKKPKTKKKEPPPIPEGVTVVNDVEIGTGGGRPLRTTLAFPKDPPVTPMPAVIWIHGGGWHKGTHDLAAAQLWLAQQGYFAASIEYRLSQEAIWPAQIEDCKLAVRWLRANAAKYNVNPDRIAAAGGSAGGHLAACLGVMDDPKFEGKGGHEGVSSRVQAVVDFSGPTDFREGSSAAFPKLTAGGAKGAPEGEVSLLIELFGGTFKEKAELYRDGSPIAYVKPGAPPFLIIHGELDDSVACAQSETLAAALQKAGGTAEFIKVKNGGHGGSGSGKIEPAARGTPAEPNDKAQQAAVVKFLGEHLKP